MVYVQNQVLGSSFGSLFKFLQLVICWHVVAYGLELSFQLSSLNLPSLTVISKLKHNLIIF